MGRRRVGHAVGVGVGTGGAVAVMAINLGNRSSTLPLGESVYPPSELKVSTPTLTQPTGLVLFTS